MKKNLLIILLSSSLPLCTTSYALHCPDPSEIQYDKRKGFYAEDWNSDEKDTYDKYWDGKPPTFDFVIWNYRNNTKDIRENIYCNYTGHFKDGSTREISITLTNAKHFLPKNDNNKWEFDAENQPGGNQRGTCVPTMNGSTTECPFDLHPFIYKKTLTDPQYTES